MGILNFQTKTHAKCILLGEHAVLRGFPAIVFPFANKHFSLFYVDNHQHPFKFTLKQTRDENLKIDFNELIQYFFKSLKLNVINNNISGELYLANNIPNGYGLGSSASISVALARFAIWMRWLSANEQFQFACTLENKFHGKSSGVDIAGVISDIGIIYHTGGDIEKLSMNWKPKLYLSSSGTHCSTAKCIEQVHEIWRSDKKTAQAIDSEVGDCVELAIQSFVLDESEGILCLQEAISRANRCFDSWKLITPALNNHINLLLKHGAIAAKPTGSGCGGYVLSLWQETPNKSFPFELIPLIGEHNEC
jgi:mevalonate kinase